MDRDVALLSVLVAHLAVAAAHGTTHALVPVALPPWANALVAGTVFVGPVAGVALARRGHPLGVPLFTVSMAAGFVLGGALHFVVENPDHVHAVPDGPWKVPFGATAAAVAVVSAIATGVGALYWRGR